MLKPVVCFVLLLLGTTAFAQESSPAVKLSQLLLQAIREKQQPVETIAKELEEYPGQLLEKELATDNFRKVFWVNVYNAYVQLQLQKQFSVINKRFFNYRSIKIAGLYYSLTDIEQTMLGVRALQHWDYRLLFVLNKGTSSSPDIAIYNPDQIDAMFDVITKLYLARVSYLEEDGFEATVPVIFCDKQKMLGGKDKVIEILRRYEVVYMNKLPRLRYRKTDGTIKPGMFISDDTLKLYLQ
jgi:hypothetical protein